MMSQIIFEGALVLIAVGAAWEDDTLYPAFSMADLWTDSIQLETVNIKAKNYWFEEERVEKLMNKEQ